MEKDLRKAQGGRVQVLITAKHRANADRVSNQPSACSGKKSNVRPVGHFSASWAVQLLL